MPGEKNLYPPIHTKEDEDTPIYFNKNEGTEIYVSPGTFV
jgi:hypothetical protein